MLKTLTSLSLYMLMNVILIRKECIMNYLIRRHSEWNIISKLNSYQLKFQRLLSQLLTNNHYIYGSKKIYKFLINFNWVIDTNHTKKCTKTTVYVKFCKKIVRLSNTRKSTPMLKCSSTMNIPSKTTPHCLTFIFITKTFYLPVCVVQN